MSKGIRIALVVCAVLAVVGLALTAAGWMMGGSLNFSLDWKNRKINTADESLTYGTLTPENCTTLELSAATADITVQRGDGWALEYALYEEPEITQENGTLTVKSEEHSAVNFIGVALDSRKAPHITVTVPADAELDQVLIATATGDILLSDLEADTVSAACATGDIRVQDVTAGRLTVTANTGDVILDNAVCATEAEIESNTGDVRVSGGSFPAGLECETNTGDVHLSLPEGDYALELEAGVGDVIVNGRDQGKSHETAGGIGVSAETNTGDVIVKIG